MTDIDDWTDYSESCSCGHDRRKHWPTECSGTRERLDVSMLPAPEYAPEDEGSPFAWPTNWPSVDAAPVTSEPCTCTSFGLAEPEPPEVW